MLFIGIGFPESHRHFVAGCGYDVVGVDVLLSIQNDEQLSLCLHAFDVVEDSLDWLAGLDVGHGPLLTVHDVILIGLVALVLPHTTREGDRINDFPSCVECSENAVDHL